MTRTPPAEPLDMRLVVRAIGAELRAARVRAGLSQRQVASRVVGLGVPTYATYDQGNQQPSPTMLIHICQVLDTDPVALFGNAIRQAEADAQSGHLPEDLAAVTEARNPTGGGRPRVWDPPMADEMRAEYEAGDTIKEISARWGISHGPTVDALRAAGTEFEHPSRRRVTTPPPKQTMPPEAQAMRRAYEDGMNVREVAAAFGLRRQAAHRLLVRAGTRMRNRQGRTKRQPDTPESHGHQRDDHRIGRPQDH